VLELRPLSPDHAAELRRIRETPEVRRWWGAVEDDFPLADDPESERFTIMVDGRVAGMVQCFEETDPDYRHAALDIFLDPAVHGRGHGTEAVRRLTALLLARGHHRLTIDPAASNRAAIRSYEKAGFRPVGVMRAYERDADGRGWHDGLLMELVVTPGR
jgi:aminoglycoside 6'-N-acetyltransferase